MLSLKENDISSCKLGIVEMVFKTNSYGKFEKVTYYDWADQEHVLLVCEIARENGQIPRHNDKNKTLCSVFRSIFRLAMGTIEEKHEISVKRLLLASVRLAFGAKSECIVEHYKMSITSFVK